MKYRKNTDIRNNDNIEKKHWIPKYSQNKYRKNTDPERTEKTDLGSSERTLKKEAQKDAWLRKYRKKPNLASTERSLT